MQRGNNISPAQVEGMLDFLSHHENLALGRVRGKEGNLLSHQLWEQIANILNKYPHGASRSAERWKKYYNQYKSRLKTKVRTIEQGGTSSANLALTPLEQRLYKLVGGNFREFDTPDPSDSQMVFAIVKPIKLISSSTILEPNLQLQAAPSKMLPSSKTHAQPNKKNEDTFEEHVSKTKYCSDKETKVEMIIKEECDDEKYTSNVDCEMTAVDHQPSKITVTVEDPLLEHSRNSFVPLPEQCSFHDDQTRVTDEDPLLEPRRRSSARLPGRFKPKPSISSQLPKKRLRSKSPAEKNDLEDINQRLLALEQSRIEADMELARAMNRQTTAIEEMLGLAKYFVNLYEKNNVQQSNLNNEQVPTQPSQISQINKLDSTEIGGLVINIKKELE